MKTPPCLRPAIAILLLTRCLATAAPATPAGAVNQLGLDLHRQLGGKAGTGNTLLSPFAVHSALTMATDGAAGKTRDELAAALHLGPNADETSQGVAGLWGDLEKAARQSAAMAEGMTQRGAKVSPLQLRLASRFFALEGLPFVPEYLDLAKTRWHAPVELLDFKTAPEPSRQRINQWVSDQTAQRIPALMPPGSVDELSRLVIASALYFKAGWSTEFPAGNTAPRPFFQNGTTEVQVPTMAVVAHFGCEEKETFTAVGLPYHGGSLQCLLLIPKERDGLAALEKSLTPALIEAAAKLPTTREVDLFLPRFKIAPPAFDLSGSLKSLGVVTAFDRTPGVADFSKMATTPLRLDSVFHQTWLALDEHGTEAAAAGTVSFAAPSAIAAEPPKRITVRADHPFLFAIQHVQSGACLFLGRVTDPKF